MSAPGGSMQDFYEYMPFDLSFGDTTVPLNNVLLTPTRQWVANGGDAYGSFAFDGADRTPPTQRVLAPSTPSLLATPPPTSSSASSSASTNTPVQLSIEESPSGFDAFTFPLGYPSSPSTSAGLWIPGSPLGTAASQLPFNVGPPTPTSLRTASSPANASKSSATSASKKRPAKPKSNLASLQQQQQQQMTSMMPQQRRPSSSAAAASAGAGKQQSMSMTASAAAMTPITFNLYSMPGQSFSAPPLLSPTPSPIAPSMPLVPAAKSGSATVAQPPSKRARKGSVASAAPLTPPDSNPSSPSAQDKAAAALAAAHAGMTPIAAHAGMTPIAPAPITPGCGHVIPAGYDASPYGLSFMSVGPAGGMPTPSTSGPSGSVSSASGPTLSSSAAAAAAAASKRASLSQAQHKRRQADMMYQETIVMRAGGGAGAAAGGGSAMSGSSASGASPSDRPHRCSLPGCNKTYKNANGLKYHLRYGHMPEDAIARPHTCPVEGCDKAYKNFNGLKYHLQHHHPAFMLAPSPAAATSPVTSAGDVGVLSATLTL